MRCKACKLDVPLDEWRHGERVVVTKRGWGVKVFHGCPNGMRKARVWSLKRAEKIGVLRPDELLGPMR